MEQAIRKTAAIIRDGGVVAYPTESVWGLGCDPFNRSAVARILALKERDPSKGLILIAADMGQLQPLVDHLADSQRQILERTWPGPLTWLVPANARTPQWITGNHESVALRVTAHPVASALCRAVGGPVVSTSANPQGGAPAKTLEEVNAYFGQSLDDVLAGEVSGGALPTEIRDLVTGAVIRPGG